MSGAAVGGFVGRQSARRLDAVRPHGDGVSAQYDDVACSGPVAVGLPCSSGNTGSHRRAEGPQPVGRVHSSNATHLTRPRHVGHCATTRQSRTRCRTGRLTRERRCQIIRAESCDHLVTSTGTLVLAIRRAREECRIR